jgi:protein-disulfide isomerase
MIETSLNRRSLIAAATGTLAAAALPRWALAMPSVSEVAHDPAIPALANPEGDVTIVEVVDYQCPYCKLCYFEIMKLVAEDPGIRLVIKDWPIFGPASEFAARSLLASADDPAYARSVDALMRNDRRLTKRRVESLIEEAGNDLSMLPYRMASLSPMIDLVLARNAAHASEFKLQGTPALLVGRTLYRHGLPLADLRRAVAEARATTDSAAMPRV